MSALCHEEVTRPGQLGPCGKVAVGMIRWHDDDLSGAYPAWGYIKACGGSCP